MATELPRAIYVDLIDRCNLRCPTCIRGVQGLKNSSSKMSLELFSEIVQKAKGEAFVTVSLFNWTEPFLASDLHEYVSIVKDFGLACGVSTNLSLRPASYIPSIQLALRSGIDALIVSVSGFYQSTYEINHVGGKISWVKENLESIAKLKGGNEINTRVFLKFLRFEYNRDEEPILRNYADSLGIEFEMIEGIGDPKGSLLDVQSEERLTERLDESVPSKPGLDEVCPMVFDTVVVDSRGTAFLCCAFPNYELLKIGSYLEMPEDRLLLSRHTHPFCATCQFPRREASEHDVARLKRATRNAMEGSGAEPLRASQGAR